MQKLVGRTEQKVRRKGGGETQKSPLSQHSKCVSVDVHKRRVRAAQWCRLQKTKTHRKKVLIAVTSQTNSQ